MYYRQLDGLRAFAVLGVIIHHWIAPGVAFEHIYHIGAHGVVLFFVLSGFLISSILFQQKETEGFSLKKGLITFYIRRSLRIFPIYYLVILLLIVFVYDSTKDFIPWLVSYQYNNHIFFFNWQNPAYIQHLWTLSIEEQFYLIWPIILFLVPVKKVNLAIFSIVLISVLSTSLLYIISPKIPYQQFTLSSFSGLAIGSYLAYIRFHNQKIAHRKILFLITLALAVYFYSPFFHFKGKSFIVTVFPFVAILSFLLVDKSIDGFNGLLGKVLESKIIVGIGRISYGLYLYHMFIPFITNYLFHINHYSWIISLIINALFLISISIFSWFLIEKPINSIKNRFHY